jgi:hypothetical protein
LRGTRLSILWPSGQLSLVSAPHTGRHVQQAFRRQHAQPEIASAKLVLLFLKDHWSMAFERLWSRENVRGYSLLQAFELQSPAYSQHSERTF